MNSVECLAFSSSFPLLNPPPVDKFQLAIKNVKKYHCWSWPWFLDTFFFSLYPFPLCCDFLKIVKTLQNPAITQKEIPQKSIYHFLFPFSKNDIFIIYKSTLKLCLANIQQILGNLLLRGSVMISETIAHLLCWVLRFIHKLLRHSDCVL